IDTVIGKGHSGALVQGSGNNQTPRRAVLRGVTNEVCGQTSFVTPLGGYGNFRFRVLVTVVERKTLYTLMAKVNRKSADLVTQATIQLMKHFEKCTHSITADNGKEFSFHEEISKTLDTAFYFAHPCHSWERGLNEYTNGLIRQYFPKSTDFKSVTNEAVCNVAEKINNRPRKSLGFKTPFQAMQDSLAKYGISLVALRS
ncbi:MAG: IS30 family transposase, partial [Gammaproteobacteria bacterium]|nr:IS30 family transposase [Gammaproteobacteria bacterium]